MPGVSTPRRCGRMLSIATSVFLLLLVVQEGGWVARADQSERDWTADRQSCLETVSSWSEAQLRELESMPPESAQDRIKLRDLLFFLHIPRTGGRTFHQCFLKHLFATDQRCPRSYDKLRIDRRQPGCRLISTHDDYSLLDNLPLDVTSVVTTLREPVGRVLSTYEFSVEVAARSLRRPAKRTVPQKRAPGRLRGSKFMSTLDIWPWKHLVPTMERDLFARRDARRAVQGNVTEVSADDSYDAALIAMPLHEFIDHQVAHELVHNGATFQVAGLTNTSFSENAGAIRHCVVRFPRLGNLVVTVAKERLDKMLYVGLTERQNESALFFAKVLRDQLSMEVLMRSLLYQEKRKPSNSAVPSSLRLQSNFTSLDEFTDEEVIAEMLASYQHCVADLRLAQEVRRSMSLEIVRPIKFSRERRKLIPDSVMEKISALNSLDTELYAHAQVLFQQQQKFLEFGSLHVLKDPNTSSAIREDLKANSELTSQRKFSIDTLKWVIALWVLVVLVLFVTVFYVVSKRRGARVKEF